MAEHLPPGDHLLTLDVAGYRREYLLHVPPGKSKPRPVVLLLHGTGGTVRWTQSEARFANFADRNNLVAVYPQAMPPDPSQPPRFTLNPPAWEDGGPPRDDRPAFDDLAYFRALLRDLLVRTPVDASRIYATGFSNGASMCYRLAAEFGDRIAAIAPIAGYCRVRTVTRPVPTLFIIGESDPMVPPLGGPVVFPWSGKLVDRPPIVESLDHWAGLLGCTTPAIFQIDQDGIRLESYRGPVDYEVVTVAGLGHHWPGGRGQLKRSLAGPWNNRLDANELVWEFFQRHRLK